MPSQQWIETQQRLAIGDRWVMDGDLGAYDFLGTRLAVADTVLVLDFSLMRCAWRAVRRSPERADFWRWTVLWRRQSRPAVMAAIAQNAASADVHLFRGPRQLARFLAQLEPNEPPPGAEPIS
ncbi:MAG: hypothetical protein M3387_07180 [Actinomycetota bacterium]|nr:hypothetical protein [Actinomycetota bacterium]